MYGKDVDSFITIELVQLREYLTLCESIINSKSFEYEYS